MAFQAENDESIITMSCPSNSPPSQDSILPAHVRMDSSSFIVLDHSPSTSIDMMSPSQSLTQDVDETFLPDMNDLTADVTIDHMDSLMDMIELPKFEEEVASNSKVKFQVDPEPIEYIVSVDVDVNRLRSPRKLFPEIQKIGSDPTPQEVVQSSPHLRVAVTEAEVKVKVDDEKEDEKGNGDENEDEDGNQNLNDDDKKQSESNLKPLRNPKDKDSEHHKKLSIQSLINLYVGGVDRLDVHFDKISVTKSNEKTLLLSSKPLRKGLYSWTLEILRCDVDLHEMGVIGTSDIDSIPVSDDGAMYTPGFKSRAVYGSDMNSGRLFYGSWNSNDTKRCHRDLTQYFNVGWTVGDMITVEVDLVRWRVKFMLNGKPVRYMMSLEPKKVYYPMICFSGNCQYYLVE